MNTQVPYPRFDPNTGHVRWVHCDRTTQVAHYYGQECEIEEYDPDKWELRVNGSRVDIYATEGAAKTAAIREIGLRDGLRNRRIVAVVSLLLGFALGWPL